MKIFKTLSRVLWGIAIVVLPFQRFWLVAEAGEAGRFNPYASIMLQASEVLILAAFLLWMASKEKLNKKFLAVVVVSAILLQFSALWFMLHIAAAAAAAVLIRNETLPAKTAVKLFLITMIFQALLGILQVGMGHSVGIPVLGESIISAQSAGVAKIVLAGKSFLRAYGTFPHPNILAGYFVMALALLITQYKKWKKGKIALTILLSAGLLLTGSKAAIGALLLTLLIRQKIPIKKKYVITGIVAFIIIGTLPFWKNAEFIIERLELLKISITMLLQQPWGVGPNHFTLAMQEFTALKLQPWQFQPVHNSYLLITNEWGVLIGFLAAFGGLHLLRNHFNKPTLVIILPLLLIGLADHYLVSLPQGVLLTGFAIGWLTRHHAKTAPTKSL